VGRYYIKNVNIINEGRSFRGDVLIDGPFIRKVSDKGSETPSGTIVIDGEGKMLIPGIIDDHVHFREPGLVHKGDISTESAAAVAGGVTSFMEMPNTLPHTTSIEELNKKAGLASLKSHANFSFYLGATNTNIDEIKKADPRTTCGVKVFMGSSTGNMLADQRDNLEKIFAESPLLIATHCEDEKTIRENLALYKGIYGENIPVWCHPMIRTGEACFLSTSLAVSLARKYGSRLHVLHLSSLEELDLFEKGAVSRKKITAEVCLHHLLFSSEDYASRGAMIKVNPAIKKEADRQALFNAVLEDRIDVVATDHAPHTLEEKQNPYLTCPSGAPMVQHGLTAMLEFWKKGLINPEKIVEKMCHAPAELFRIDRRGFIREGYYADLVLVNPDHPWDINKSNLLSKCRWSPLENMSVQTRVDTTFVNGEPVYRDGRVSDTIHSMQLRFDR